MAEVIIKRAGNPSERNKANKQLENIGSLREVYKSAKIKVDNAQNILETEDTRLQRSRDLYSVSLAKLTEIQEIIDAEPLPEGAQPVARIQQRNLLMLV